MYLQRRSIYDMNIQLFMRQQLFTELKNLYSFSRYFDSKFRKYKGLTIGSELQMHFSARSCKMSPQEIELGG